MRRGYIRLAKAGISRKEQELALRSAGIENFSAFGPVYVEPLVGSATKYEQRDAAIRALRKDDELVIATPGCLGGTRADVLTALAAISARGAALHVVSTGATVRWSAEAAAAAEFAAQAESEGAARRAKHARMSRGVESLGGRKPKLVKGSSAYERVEALWRDTAKSAAEVAEETGYSAATLYRLFGAKGTPLFGGNVGRKPAKKPN